MKFPVWQTAVDVYGLLWQERRQLVRHGTLPFLFSFAASVFAKGLGMYAETAEVANLPKWLLIGVLQLVIFVPMTVTWYRLCTLGHAEGDHRPTFALGRLERRFLLWQVVLGALVGLGAGVGLIGGAIVLRLISPLGLDARVTGQVGGMLSLGFAGGAALLVLARLSLVTVQAALGQPVDFKESWRVTKGMGWRIATALLLVTLPVGAFNFVNTQASDFAHAGPPSALKNVLGYATMMTDSAAGVVAAATAATLMSFVYRILMTRLEQPARDQPV